MCAESEATGSPRSACEAGVNPSGRPRLHVNHTNAVMAPPSILIRLELERDRPMVVADALTDGEALRLRDWISRRPDLRELLLRALELAYPEPEVC
jgi:hypothetical protein